MEVEVAFAKWPAEVMLFCVKCGFSQVGFDYALWLTSWCTCPKCGGPTDGVAK